MVTLFHVNGAYIYVDVDGNAVGIEDVSSARSTKPALTTRKDRFGLGADFVDQFIR